MTGGVRCKQMRRGASTSCSAGARRGGARHYHGGDGLHSRRARYHGTYARGKSGGAYEGEEVCVGGTRPGVVQGVARRKIHARQAGGRARSSVIVARAGSNRGNGGKFAAGFFLGGVVCGVLGWAFAPDINRRFFQDDEGEKVELPRGGRPAGMREHEDELRATRQSLSEKITQLNRALDSVQDDIVRASVNVSNGNGIVAANVSGGGGGVAGAIVETSAIEMNGGDTEGGGSGGGENFGGASNGRIEV